MVIYLCFLESIILLLFIFVSGLKNKIRFRIKKFLSTYSIKNYHQSTDNYNEFLYWFSGFSDAEGNFLVTIDRSYVKLRFKINLHLDDLAVLYIIQSRLGFGRVVKEPKRNSCYYIVEDILNVTKLCDILKNYPLHTSKKLDFNSFYEVLLIKINNKTLSDKNIEKIRSIKNSMNSKREIFICNVSESQIIIDPNWFIGFIEGEGTFGIKTGSSLYFQVAQKNTSQDCLNSITQFLLNLSKNLIIDNDLSKKIQPINVLNSINVRTNVVSLSIASVDALYYYLLPFLEKYSFYSRKEVDFKLWRMALILKIKGYYYTTEGKNLFLDISEILNKRYSTNPLTEDVNSVIDILIERFNNILRQDPPFNVNLNIPHIENVRKYSIANRSENPKTVYIYVDNEMIKGSPFSSYSSAHKALGLKPSSNTCNRYIDTNRLYKNKYIFTSKPIDSASRG
uniref:LAGLIDADG endonuclease n=3 Tax=Ceratocystis TaxID=5157 RepID=A0A5C1VC81_9PEZI|nr:LAGLIDADG endonuclease [Ceratocystis cacaofunesta]YP_009704202.1 LAGLIDADG endonuclease [Ceratocystis fimbriata]YP_009710354.1 LAGLIDADG endonuclease [Ceratocystis albifundus]AFO38116.1 LAGLIDADG endonuclease [Ceratocystis cacaofunesta]QEN73765.1 LAGLIDADG endonuclease [Ceratocystis fimbriata]QFX74856.1 LAGLIDADG endonuclease [Ceratocystis albifundus]WPM94724.1 hypothetical protein [Ceratocystis fimbriata]WPM94775.1 hypothetical protein [Ceratocystis fimbriata]